MQWLLVLLIIVLLILFFISAGLLTQASTKIGPGTTDPNLSYAYSILTWLVVLIWLLVALIIIGIIIYFIFYAEASPEIELASAYNQLKQNETTSTLGVGLTILLFVIIVLVIIVGVFAAIAASSISKYGGYKTQPDIYRAYEDCAISAVLCLGAIGIIIGILIYYYWPETTIDNTVVKTDNTKAFEMANVVVQPNTKQTIKVGDKTLTIQVDNNKS